MGFRGYALLFFVAAWMFFLGILVGRGTAPVSFDTTAFQTALSRIASESWTEPELPATSDLDFYDALKKPVPTGGGKNPALDSEIFPADRNLAGTGLQDKGASSERVVKRSRKAMTRTAESKKVKQKTFPSAVLHKPTTSSMGAEKKQGLTRTQKDVQKAVQDDFSKSYTIQVAAFRALLDTLQKKKEVESKGYTCYRTMAKKDNKIWHRLRIGSFKTKNEARKVLDRLKADNLNGMIIVKE